MIFLKEADAIHTNISIINKSYCLISQHWGKNQLGKEEKTTEEETVQLISLSPSWLQQSPDNKETKENKRSLNKLLNQSAVNK